MADATQARLLVAGGAQVFATKGEAVAILRIQEGQGIEATAQHLWAGSYGIRRENVAGHTVFEHRKTWGVELGFESERAA